MRLDRRIGLGDHHPKGSLNREQSLLKDSSADTGGDTTSASGRSENR